MNNKHQIRIINGYEITNNESPWYDYSMMLIKAVPKNLKRLNNQIKKIKNNRYKFPVRIQPALDSESSLFNYYQNEECKIRNSCGWAKKGITIDPQGNVSICGFLPLGNIQETQLKVILNSKKYIQMKKRLSNPDLCFCQRCCIDLDSDSSTLI